MRNKKIVERLTCRITYMICAFTLFFSSCQKSDLDGEREKQAEPKPAITLNLDFGGAVETTLMGEEFKAMELSATEEELRSAGINLKRDPQSRQFKVNLDISKGKELPVVVACRRTVGANKQMFVAKTTLTLLTEQQGGKEVANRKFRIKKGGVQFYQLNADGSRVSNFTTFDNFQEDKNAKYEVKLFVGADVKDSQGQYVINYGLDNKTNGSPLVMMEDDGHVSFESMQGKIPFLSDWTVAQFARDVKTGVGLSTPEGDGGARIKAKGSMLMFTIANYMTESKIHLNSLRIYSESLTSNIVYPYDATNNDYLIRPAFKFKANPTEPEKYFNTVSTPRVVLAPQSGGHIQKKTFVFWAQLLPEKYLHDEKWLQTSVVAQIKEVQKDGKKYWFNLPLLKTYDPLRKLHDGRVSKTEVKIENETPIHPMNLMAHRFVWDADGGNATTKYDAVWRKGPYYYASAYYDGYTKNLIYNISEKGWDERYYVTFGPDRAALWRAEGVNLEFGRVNHTNPMTFDPGETETYKWRTTSLDQLAALFPRGYSQDDRNKTNSFDAPKIIREQAWMQDYPIDPDFYSIIYRKYNLTYAIRFLRKTKDGQYYMTPYTAAYRYDRKSVWTENKGDFINSSQDNLYSTLEIRMRPLGGTTHQYNERDGEDGYYSPKFSEAELRSFFAIITLDRVSNVLSNSRWWIDNPLKEDDVVREYPALGFWGPSNALWYPGSRLSIMTHSRTRSGIDKNYNAGTHNVFTFSREDDFKFDWYSKNDFSPIILLADRKIIHQNSN